MINPDRYKKLNNNLSEYELPEILAYIPTPTEIEYKRGYIQRYFVQNLLSDVLDQTEHQRSQPDEI